jgi:hypothetical protein
VHADPQEAFIPVLHLAEIVVERMLQYLDLPQVPGQTLSRFGQNEAGLPSEKPYAVRFFQSFDVIAETLLRNENSLGDPPDVQFLGDQQEIFLARVQEPFPPF